MTEHTPGPWKWYWREENGEADCGVFHEARPGHAYAVARCPRYEKEEQWQANARLIAASPVLLEVAKQALQLIAGDARDGWLGHHADNPVPAALRAAIAEAEGELDPRDEEKREILRHELGEKIAEREEESGVA